MWIRILSGAPVITQIRLPEGSCVVLIGRHGATNPAGRVRCDMLDLSVPVAQPFGGLEREAIVSTPVAAARPKTIFIIGRPSARLGRCVMILSCWFGTPQFPRNWTVAGRVGSVHPSQGKRGRCPFS